MENFEYEKMAKIEKDNWWFYGKRKIFFLFLERFIKDKNASLLDLGCGTGGVINDLKTRGYKNIAGLDISAKAIGYCRAMGLDNVKQGSGDKMPFADQSFDAVIALDLLEHIDNDVAVLKEVKRILKAEGMAFFSVPAYAFLYSYHDRYLHHQRRYSKKDLIRKAQASGFLVTRVTYTNSFILPLVILIRAFRTIFKAKQSDVRPINSIINKGFKLFYPLEVLMLKYFNLPFGSSLFMVVRKK